VSVVSADRLVIIFPIVGWQGKGWMLQVAKGVIGDCNRRRLHVGIKGLLSKHEVCSNVLCDSARVSRKWHLQCHIHA